jgi:hypothetical protein
MNPAPSLYSNAFKIRNIHLLESQSQSKHRSKKGLNRKFILNKREGAG